jgi:two-component system CheB/CheR fusion protein
MSNNDNPRRRVLVVDDNVDSAESMAVLLRLEGHEAHTLHDGERVVATARELRPDVILLDIGLPGITGYEVARRIREDGMLSGVALVAVSGYGREEDLSRARAAGFDRHLVKPVDFDALHEVLARLQSGSPDLHR